MNEVWNLGPQAPSGGWRAIRVDIPAACVRASTDEQRTGYALGVAIVQTAQRRSHDVGWRETHLYTRLSLSLYRLYTPSSV